MKERTKTPGIPDNLRLQNGVLSTVNGQSVPDYLNERCPHWVDKPAQAVIIINRDRLLQLMADSEELKRQSFDGRFILAA